MRLLPGNQAVGFRFAVGVITEAPRPGGIGHLCQRAEMIVAVGDPGGGVAVADTRQEPASRLVRVGSHRPACRCLGAQAVEGIVGLHRAAAVGIGLAKL